MTGDDGDRNSGRDTAGRFAPGNPGKPAGARNRATQTVEAILTNGAERVGRKALRMALGGDSTALRLVLERVAPVRRDRPVTIALPAIESVADHPAVLAQLVSAMGRGEIAPAEAEAFAAVLAQHRAAVEVADLEARIAALEARQGRPARARA
jgi:hypothetical protein